MNTIKFFSLLISFLAVAGTSGSHAFSIVKPTTTIDKYEQAKFLNLSSIIHLSVKQFSELTGKKMNMWDKLSFSIMKTKMKHDLKKNPNLTLNEYYAKEGKKGLGTVWWILIGIAGLLLLGVIIFVIAYGSGSD